MSETAVTFNSAAGAQDDFSDDSKPTAVPQVCPAEVNQQAS